MSSSIQSMRSKYHATPMHGSLIDRIGRMHFVDGGKTGDYHTTVTTLAKTVMGEIDFLRNTVVPLIETVEKDTLKYIAKRKLTVEKKPFSIDMIAIPSVLENDVLFSQIEALSNRGNNKIDETIVLPVFLSVDISTGSRSLDDVISKWIDESGIDLVEFANEHMTHIGEYTLTGGKTTIDDYLAMFYITDSLIDNPPEGVNMSIDEYNRRMERIKTCVGDIIYNRYVSLLDMLENDNILIISSNLKANTVRVNSRVYTKWLESGGAANIIQGIMLLNNHMLTSVSDIEKSKEDALTALRVHNNLDAIDTQTYMLRIVKASLKDATTKNNISNNLIDKFISDITSEDIDDIGKLVMTAVTITEYGHTNANHFLSEMESARARTGENNPKVLGLYAMISYLVRFTTSQLLIERM